MLFLEHIFNTITSSFNEVYPIITRTRWRDIKFHSYIIFLVSKAHEKLLHLFWFLFSSTNKPTKSTMLSIFIDCKQFSISTECEISSHNKFLSKLMINTKFKH